MRLKTKDGKFYAEFNILTPLEWLDLEYNEGDSDAMIFASEVALAVTDWNGQGKVDPLWLLSDRSNHQLVYLVSKAIDKTRPKVPQLQSSDNADCLFFSSKEFYCKVNNLTVLEFMDVLSRTRKTHGDDLKSRFKCTAIASVVQDWNGKGSVSADELYERENHQWVVALDMAIAEFFRDDEDTILESDSILDNSNDNGRDDVIESTGVEPQKHNSKGFSVNVAGVSRS